MKNRRIDINKIIQLEKAAQLLEPTQKERTNLLKKTIAFADEFINDMEKNPSYYSSEHIKELDNSPIGAGPYDMEHLLELLDRTIIQSGINPASGGHLGYIPGRGVFTAALGDYIAAISNRYAGLYFANPGSVKIENQLIRWVCNLIGYDSKALGNIASGGSIANLTALVTARDSKNINAEKIKQAVIYHTQQTHHCIAKAVRIAGLNDATFRKISVDEHYRMNAEELQETILKDKEKGLIPFYIAASAGTTDTGAIDPIDKLADIAQANELWLHIDGAYGGFFILVDELKEKFKGIERADSIVLDPHKSLFLPYGIGIVLVKDGAKLYNSFYYKANYLQDAQTTNQVYSPADLSPELTKHFRGLRMWLPLQLHGIAPFKNNLTEKRLLTLYLYEKLQSHGFELGPQPDLSVIIYRWPYQGSIEQANRYNERLTQLINEDGTIFISSTTIDEKFWIRAAIVSFRTHLRTINKYIELLLEKNAFLKDNF